MTLDFERVLGELSHFCEQHEFRFALIGGLSLAAYGLARTTLDIDLVVERRAQTSIIEQMEAMGYQTLHCSRGYSNHLHSDPDDGRVDWVYVSKETARQLFEETTSFTLPGGLRIPVPRAEHLIAMKVAAMKNDPSRTLQDLADIRHLLLQPEVDLDEARRYFAKHDLLERFHELKATF